MPLETATYFTDLVTSNPAHTDGLNQGDAHLRLIKSTVQASFKNWTSTSGVGSVGYLSATQAQLDNAVNLLTGVSGAAAFPAGTVGAPSIAFTGDPDSGFFKAAEDNIALAINGVNQFNVSPSGCSVGPPLNAFGGVAATGTVSATGAYSGGTGQLAMPGAIWIYQGPSAPTGWTWCNGVNTGITTGANPGLNAIYGSTGGLINIPDFRDFVPIGQGTLGGTSDRGLIAASGVNASIDTMNGAVGQATHQLTTGECPTGLITFNDAQHAHTIPFAFSSPNVWSSGANGAAFAGSAGTTTTSSVFTGCSLTDHGGNGAHNITQLGIVVGFIIKLG